MADPASDLPISQAVCPAVALPPEKVPPDGTFLTQLPTNRRKRRQVFNASLQRRTAELEFDRYCDSVHDGIEDAQLARIRWR